MFGEGLGREDRSGCAFPNRGGWILRFGPMLLTRTHTWSTSNTSISMLAWRNFFSGA
jgi:hypothetical protein